jgi:DNA-binding transcriptional MocR family regulator
MSTRATANDIAADLALAIHQGLIRPGQQVPSQAHLMKSYNVAMGTAAAALGKLAAAGLARGEPGRGTYAMDRVTLALKSAPVLDILAAASLCRSIAAATWPPDAAPVARIGGHPDYGTPYEDENTLPPRPVDIALLADLDRHVLRWMSEALYDAARRAAGAGLGPADDHLLAAARAILRDGARRPDGQPPIAAHGGIVPPGEAVALRIWPERAHHAHGPDDPPF